MDITKQIPITREAIREMDINIEGTACRANLSTATVRRALSRSSTSLKMRFKIEVANHGPIWSDPSAFAARLKLYKALGNVDPVFAENRVLRRAAKRYSLAFNTEIRRTPALREAFFDSILEAKARVYQPPTAAKQAQINAWVNATDWNCRDCGEIFPIKKPETRKLRTKCPKCASSKILPFLPDLGSQSSIPPSS